jgi:hypothetical protein
MLPTHIILGLALLSPVFVFLDAPSSSLYGVIIGSVLPDLDLIYGTHRQTFHFPVYSIPFVIFSGVLMLVVPSVELWFVFGVISGFSFHSISDVFGSGLEVRPWERNSKKAVYNHYHSRWEKPTHILSYDGSPTDLIVSLVGSVVLWRVLVRPYDLPYIDIVLLLCICVGVSYTVSRRALPIVDKWLYTRFVWMRPVLELVRDSNRVVSRESDDED